MRETGPTDNGSKNSAQVKRIITKFRVGIHAALVYSHTGYDIITYYLAEVIAKKLSKIPPPMASGGISPERFKLISYHEISQTYRGQSTSQPSSGVAFRIAPPVGGLPA